MTLMKLRRSWMWRCSEGSGVAGLPHGCGNAGERGTPEIVVPGAAGWVTSSNDRGDHEFA